ncbi:uncharacterized protein HMPREF1541_10800 [Cyphellophora europaea CBS 101466]|uniref:AMP-dependent synthetase/ligase domain-containing protein n=1 Tax=Cyphellophora europaea (strain CBS 101466) TaxID=1220924 RepID=W2S8J0_CYPE1|nr:uncharacterized protein HMPREF1541_10800 [Cyphellophora europaea CBS 101466]ETN44249.1 hypothetical protein HMPREF1541_10800 [Cyphellophora europaea CBS 101466]
MAVATGHVAATGGSHKQCNALLVAEVDKIWRSESVVKIPTGPTADILSYAFACLGQYDEDKPIFVDALNASNTFSAREARATVRKLIAGLKAHGLQEGDCVWLHAFNTIWYPLIWLAVIGAGGIIFGTNPSAPRSELLHNLGTTRPKLLVTEVASLNVAEQVAASCGIADDQVFVLAKTSQSVPAGRLSFLKLLSHGECGWDVSTGHENLLASRIAAYCTTSGTTGLPKAAKIPHSYVVAQAAMIEQRLKSRPYQPSQLVCLPVFHAFAAQLGLVQPLRLGITTYFLPRFDLDNFIESVRTYQITDAAIVPPIVTALLRRPHADTGLKSLRYVLCAGAPITAELQAKLYQFLHPDATVGQVWGATELGWVTMFAPGEKDQSGSIGTLLANVELKLEDVDGRRICTDLVHGEALVRSPCFFSDYLDNPEASASAFDDDGFYRTGDRVYVEGDQLYIDGRIKETMKVNGWQVSPTELENVLLQHPSIADAAVVGIYAINQDGLEVTRPRAYVVQRLPESSAARSELTAEDVASFLASRLVSYKRLTGGVVFVAAIPRNSTGKILRRLLLAKTPDDTS